MVNISLDYLRKNDSARQMLPLDQIPENIEEPREEDISQVPHKVLMKFIAELPSGYRTVFNLYVMIIGYIKYYSFSKPRCFTAS